VSNKVVEFPRPESGRVPVEDDGCRWIKHLPGGPFAVLPCDVCQVPVVIESAGDRKHHRVRCPRCGKHTPDVISGSLLGTLELWNVMVEHEQESGTDPTSAQR
jgi:hypothetical protein